MRLWRAAKPANKLKVLIGFYMIAIKIESIYEVELPEAVRRLMGFFTVSLSMGLNSSNDVLTCLGLDGFAYRLLFWLVAPLVLVGMICVASFGLLIWERRRAFTDDERGLSLAKYLVTNAQLNREQPFHKLLLQVTLPKVLQALFLAYPLVTNAAFEAFSCLEFQEDDLSWLRADVSIVCSRDGETTDDKQYVEQLAYLAMAYPFGLIVIYAALLFAARNAILTEQPTPLSLSIRFLYAECT